MQFDVEKARRDTPASANLVHFNNAGSSLPPSIVIKTVMDYLQRESEVGGYELAALKAEEIDASYKSIASLIGAKREEIGRETNATRAWELAFYAVEYQKGDRILTTKTEYSSNFVSFLHLRKKIGVEIQVVPNDDKGQLDVYELEKMIDERVKLVSINHIPTNSGLINPAVEVGKITSDHNILYQLDACQSVGQMPVNVSQIRCDFLSATGRKYLRAPRGTGFLFVSEKVTNELDPPILDGYAAEWTEPFAYELNPTAKKFETFEYSVADFLGLGAAVDYALSWGLDKIWKRIDMLATYLRGQLAEINSIRMHDIGEYKCGIVTFSVDDQSALEVRNKLYHHNINVSVVNPQNALIDTLDRGLKSILRASLHYYNTIDEIEKFCEILGNI